MPRLKVYLDNCANNRPFDDQKQIKIALETKAKRHIQRLITEQNGIKTKDALHISCAIEGDCAYFITTDKALLRYTSPYIVVCDPVAFISYLEDAHE
jgi:predicted nucleic acid-binding protein